MYQAHTTLLPLHFILPVAICRLGLVWKMLAVTTSIGKPSQETPQGLDVGPGGPLVTQLNLSHNRVRAGDILLLDSSSPSCWVPAAGLLQPAGSWALGSSGWRWFYSGVAELPWAVLAWWLHTNPDQGATSAGCAHCPSVAARLGCAQSIWEAILCLSLSLHLVLMSITTAEPIHCP